MLADVKVLVCRDPEAPVFKVDESQTVKRRAEKSLEGLSWAFHWPVASPSNFVSLPPGPQQTKHKIEEGSWPTSLRSELWTGVDAQWGRAGGLGRCTVVSSGGLLRPSRPFPQSHTRQCQTHEAFRILSNPRFFPPANIGSGRSDMGFPPNWGGWHSCVVGWQSSYHWRRWQACCQCCNAGNRLRNEKANRAGWDASLDRDGRTDMDDKGELGEMTNQADKGREAEMTGLVELARTLMNWSYPSLSFYRPQHFQRVGEDAAPRPVEDLLEAGFCPNKPHCRCPALSTVQLSGIFVCSPPHNLCPLLFWIAQEGRCGACVLLVGSLWASEALPLEVSSISVSMLFLSGCSIPVWGIRRSATGDGLTILVRSQFEAIFVQKLVIALSL